jgi:hypothetical protein
VERKALMGLRPPISLANLLQTGLGILLALLVIEGALRVVPNRWQAGIKLFTFDPQIGILPAPSQTFNRSGKCFYVEKIHINSLGFRDREREFRKKWPKGGYPWGFFCGGPSGKG